MIVELSRQWCEQHAPLWWNHRNQLRRALGPYTVVYNGGTNGGTVQDAQGMYWDWWPTGERDPRDGQFSIVRIVEAR